jgi:hypothetical protein
VGVQEVTWEGSDIEPAGEYTFFNATENENNELCTSLSVHKRITSAVKRVEFISYRIVYIMLRGCWFYIILLNVYAPAEDKVDVKDSFYEELKFIFHKFPKYH